MSAHETFRRPLPPTTCPECGRSCEARAEARRMAASYQACLRQCQACGIGWSNARSTPTLIYREPERNVPPEVRTGLLDSLDGAANVRNRPNKRVKFGFETSEDALTWTVFQYLKETGQLWKVAVLAGLTASAGSPSRLALWGVSQDSASISMATEFVTVSNALNEEAQSRSEPDVMLDCGQAGVVMVEVKYRSRNDVLSAGDRRWDRYMPSAAFKDPASIKASGLYELARNWRIGWELARSRPMALLNLTSPPIAIVQAESLKLFEHGVSDSPTRVFRWSPWSELITQVDLLEPWFTTYIQRRHLFEPVEN